jgi:hypothetical protein
MPYNVLLLPLLGGFVFINFWDRTRWHAQRAEKERLLFYAALAGFLLLGLSILARSFFRYCFTEPVCPWWDRNVGFPYSGVSTLALVLGLFGWWPLNRLADVWFDEWGQGQGSASKRRELVRVIEEHGGPLERMFLRAMNEDKNVMITLNNGKVYIGGMGASFTPDRDKTIFLLPSKSGYRQIEVKGLMLTTHYDTVYEQIANDYKDNPQLATEIIATFGVVIPIAEIISVSLYLADIDAKYFPRYSTTPPSAQPNP